MNKGYGVRVLPYSLCVQTRVPTKSPFVTFLESEGLQEVVLQCIVIEFSWLIVTL